MTKFLLLLFILILTCTVLSKNTKNLPGVIQDHGEMILIPEGDFLMGTSEEEIKKIAREFKKSYKYFLSETPEHKVFLSAYYIDKYEVSNRQYQKFIEAGGYENHIFWTEEGWIWKEKNVYEEPKWWLSGQNKSGINHPDYPVVGVSWYEAYAYAKWANKRLPTESEWEKASRGTEGFIYPWGMEWDINKSVSMGKEIQPVGSIEEGKSSYSVMDMSGNVWEWCSDWYDPKYYISSPYKNPPGPKEGQYKILRGGCGGNSHSYYFRCSNRHWAKENFWDAYTGFRCVKDI